jgi:DNA polymerase III psi subunit
MTNRLKNERGKEKNAKNTSITQRVILPLNPEDIRRIRDLLFHLKSWFLHKSQNLCPSFEAQTHKPATDGFEAQTTKAARE